MMQTTPEIAFALLVLLVGVPAAALRNWTAVGLIIGWVAAVLAAAFALASKLADYLPLPLYFVCDCVVVALMYSKTFRTARESRVVHLWTALSGWDRAILAAYVFGAWPVYLSGLDKYYVYWALYWLTAAQFVLAGGEALQSLFVKRPRYEVPKFDPVVAPLRFAW